MVERQPGADRGGELDVAEADALVAGQSGVAEAHRAKRARRRRGAGERAEDCRSPVRSKVVGEIVRIGLVLPDHHFVVIVAGPGSGGRCVRIMLSRSRNSSDTIRASRLFRISCGLMKMMSSVRCLLPEVVPKRSPRNLMSRSPGIPDLP